MKLEQIYTGCLSHAAYYLESNGEAAIFDPLRDVQPYIDRASEAGVVIKYVFETHFHADFVSGHLELKRQSDAQIVFGPTANPNYTCIVAKDRQEFYVGNILIEVLHTPGHTMESCCYLIYDENKHPYALISGDTLMIGDVGRPDLVQLVRSEITQELLAGYLFDSLRNKVMSLPDHVIVYPNHGKGSACGKNMSSETFDTLGNQKKTNYALRFDMTKQEFIEELLNGLATPPQYFPSNVIKNISGYESSVAVLERAKTGLSCQEILSKISQEDILILDTRDAEVFSKGFIKGSLNIGLNGAFAGWVGELIGSCNQKIILVCHENTQQQALVRLSRIGYDGTIGYLDEALEDCVALLKQLSMFDQIKRIDDQYVDEWVKDNNATILDVRKDSEFFSEAVIGSKHISLNQLKSNLNNLDKSKKHIVMCGGGYRSMMACSILAASGFNHLIDVRQGFSGVKKYTTLPLSEYVCPKTML